MDFKEGEINGVEQTPLRPYYDKRGWLIELFRSDDMPEETFPLMAYVSCTAAGEKRGPHEHVTQTDYFCFVGPGNFLLYLWDNRIDSSTYQNTLTIGCGASNPMAISVPPGVVHAYKNISPITLPFGFVFNAPNQLYGGQARSQPIDEIRHENNPDSPFIIPEY